VPVLSEESKTSSGIIPNFGQLTKRVILDGSTGLCKVGKSVTPEPKSKIIQSGVAGSDADFRILAPVFRAGPHAPSVRPGRMKIMQCLLSDGSGEPSARIRVCFCEDGSPDPSGILFSKQADYFI
jgi:hypothetical protein